jgi:DNA-binding PadR family transcriptional regulator
VSSTRLLVLGVLRAEEAAHGYEIRRELETWGAQRWANVAPGSVYHALTKMAREGLVEKVETEEPSKGPARTAYAVTKLGEREFQRLLREYLWKENPTMDPFQLALAFLDTVPGDEILAALKRRASSARAAAEALRFVNEAPGQDLPAHVVEGHLLAAYHAEAEARWAEEAAEKVERGELP